MFTFEGRLQRSQEEHPLDVLDSYISVGVRSLYFFPKKD